MSTLHVRNVPPEIYASLRRRARERKSSISVETIRLLGRALRVDRPGVRELLEEIESERAVARRAPACTLRHRRRSLGARAAGPHAAGGVPRRPRAVTAGQKGRGTASSRVRQGGPSAWK